MFRTVLVNDVENDWRCCLILCVLPFSTNIACGVGVLLCMDGMQYLVTLSLSLL